MLGLLEISDCRNLICLRLKDDCLLVITAAHLSLVENLSILVKGACSSSVLDHKKV